MFRCSIAPSQRPLSLQQWAICVAMGSSVLWISELRKALIRFACDVSTPRSNIPSLPPTSAGAPDRL